MHSQSRHLLIISCTRRKSLDAGLIPAIARYDGPTFRVLRRFLHQKSSNCLDVYILSAKFGLISHQELIPYYDQKMTRKRAEKLQPEVILQIEEIISHNSYQRLLICASKNYFYVLEGYEKFIKPDLSLEIATGAIGKKLVSLYTWLYGHPPELKNTSKNLSYSGKIHFKGMEISMTTEEVIDVAHQALLEKKGNSTSYQSWYVLIDEKKVSPKWLVSQLTGLPVSKFHSVEARGLLQQLGFEIFAN
ncbi:MAG: hypothetical protein F6K39_09750 [Okeania sp. SIO3B3]|nr:hypothetical protein [Okeania sp. SIO3B3]